MEEVLNINPRDYSDEIKTVFFCVANISSATKALKNLNYIKNIETVQDGFKVQICVQQIPEIIRFLSLQNIAIYSVIPLKK